MGLVIFFTDFYPRTPTGCDIIGSLSFIKPFEFLSTHPYGVRHIIDIDMSDFGFISIHAPLRGATLC